MSNMTKTKAHYDKGGIIKRLNYLKTEEPAVVRCVVLTKYCLELDRKCEVLILEDSYSLIRC